MLKRVLRKCKKELRRAVFFYLDIVLKKWGRKLGVPGNLRARIAWRAGRKEMDDLESLYDFWRQEHPDGNYFSTPDWSPRSETIITMISPWVTQEASILEVGCNVGRNLNHLWNAGFQNLRGIEISIHAVRRLREAYPSLADILVDTGPAEVVLQHYDSDSFDLIFTMAVLEHIHPSSPHIFGEIARVARRYVLAVEPRKGHASHRQYPWSIVKEFESVGLKLIDRKAWSSLWPTDLTQENQWHKSFDGYDAMLFEVPQK